VNVPPAKSSATLDSERFADLAPPQVHAQLVDDGVYLCSVSTETAFCERAAKCASAGA